MANKIEGVMIDKSMEVGSDNKMPSKEEIVMLVQHDWNHASSEQGESFFVGYRRPNEKTKFFNVAFGKENDEFQDEVLKCRRLPRRALSLEFNELNLRKTFVAPVAEYDHLHKAAVSTLDVSSTGNLVVSADSYTGLLVWDTDNSEILRELKGHVLDVNVARFFPSGMVVLSGGLDMAIRIWSVESGDCPRILKGHKAPILDLAFVGRGEEVLSTARDGTVRKWSCGRGECITTLNVPNGSANCLGLNAERSLVAVGSDKGYVHLYDPQSKKIVSDLFLNTMCTSLVTQGDYVFIGGDNGVISVIDLKTNGISHSLSVNRGRVHKLLVMQNGLLASFADGGVCFYDDPEKSSQSKVEFTGADCDPVYDVAHSSKYLFTACRDKNIRKYAFEALLH